MNQAFSRRFSVLTCLLAQLGATAATAQYFPTPPEPELGRPAVLPRSGVVTPTPYFEAKMQAQAKAPEGFSISLFAGPPLAGYPVCLAEGSDGAIYVCVDPNSSLSRITGIGRVMRFMDDNN